jgi:hypothetical protein
LLLLSVASVLDDTLMIINASFACHQPAVLRSGRAAAAEA